MPKIFECLNKIISSTRGNVAFVVALAAATAFTLVSGAIELNRVATRKAELQAAADAAVLVAAKEFKSTKTLDRKLTADNLNANLPSGEIYGIYFTLQIETVNGHDEIALRVWGKQNLIIGGFLPVKSVSVYAAANSLVSQERAEIAYVVDTTGSLNTHDRIDNLKSALIDLTNKIYEADVGTKIALVPFNTQVAMETDMSAQWIDWGQSSNDNSCDDATYDPTYPDFCKVSWAALDGMCYNAIDRWGCKDRAKIYHSVPVISGGRSTYELIAKSYEMTASGYNILTRRIVLSKDDAPSVCTSYFTDESGTTCTAWSDTHENVEIDEQTDFASQADLTILNEVPAGMTLATRPLSIVSNFSNGYGGAQAWTENYMWLNSKSVRNKGVKASADMRNLWEGCIIDRRQPFDVSAQSPNFSNSASLYPARACEFNPPLPKIIPLSENFEPIKSSILSINPNGNTNITIGVQWGIEALTPQLPLTGGEDFTKSEVRKILILITDGENTANSVTRVTKEIDARTALVCKAAKDIGVEIFAIRLEDGNQKLLRECATDSSHYFDVASASDLKIAMQALLQQLSKPRLTK